MAMVLADSDLTRYPSGEYTGFGGGAATLPILRSIEPTFSEPMIREVYEPVRIPALNGEPTLNGETPNGGFARYIQPPAPLPTVSHTVTDRPTVDPAMILAPVVSVPVAIAEVLSPITAPTDAMLPTETAVATAPAFGVTPTGARFGVQTSADDALPTPGTVRADRGMPPWLIVSLVIGALLLAQGWK